MKKIPPNRVRSHADYDLAPLGMWANHRDAATLTAGGQRVQRLNDLPNPFASDASMKFEEAVAACSRLRHDKPAWLSRTWRRCLAGPALKFWFRIGASSKSIF